MQSEQKKNLIGYFVSALCIFFCPPISGGVKQKKQIHFQWFLIFSMGAPFNPKPYHAGAPSVAAGIFGSYKFGM